MYWQRKIERRSVAMALNNVYKLLLPYSGLLGSIQLHITGDEVSPLGANGGAWRIMDFISQIQVVANGSTVVKSITGEQAQALAFYDQGVVPPGKWRNYAGNTQFENFLINFGRWLKDDSLGLDLSQYSSVELWITNTALVTQFTDLTVTVTAYYMQDAPARPWPAYMRTEEWQAWVTAQDQWVYNNLPTEYLIRRVMLHAVPSDTATSIETTTMNNLMDEVKFALDTGNVLVLDHGLDFITRENFMEDGKAVFTVGWPYITNAHGIRMGVGEPLVSLVTGGAQVAAVPGAIPTVESARSDGTAVNYGYDADNPEGMLNYGLGPFHCGLIKCSEYDDPSTFLDPMKRATVKLDIHTRNLAAAVGGRNAIVLDRLVPNGK